MSGLSYRRARGITPQQASAVELVAVGMTDLGVAERVGLARETVTRWRLYDPEFQAAVNTFRTEMWSGIADSARAVLPMALDTVREQLRVGPRRDRLALDLLTRSGVMGKPYSGALGTPGGPVGIGHVSADPILDDVVRRRRAEVAAEDEAAGRPFDDLLEGPISEEERDGAYAELMALAGRDTEDGGADSVTTDHK